MAKISLLKGITSQTVHLFIQDSTSTTGTGKTGLVFNTASLTCYYARPRAAAVAVALVTQTVTGAYASGGFIEIDATNMPGWYRFDPPDAALASGVESVGFHFRGATGMAPLPLEIELVDFSLHGQSAIDLKDFADDGYDPATNKVQGVVLVDTMTTYTGDTPQTGDSFARLGATGSGLTSLASAANLAAVAGYLDTEIAAIIATLGAAGAGLTALGDARIANLDATLSSRASQTSVDDLPTNAELATALAAADDAILAAIAALNNLSQANIRTAVGLGSANLDTQLGDLPTNAELATALGTADDAVLAQVALVKGTTDKLDTALELDGAVYRYTTNALEQAPTGGAAPSAAVIADAVWDEVLADHLTAGSTGAGLNAAGSAGDPWTTALPGAYGAGTAGQLVGANLNATVASRATQTSVDDLPTNAELTAALAAADDAVLAAIAVLNNLSAAEAKAQVVAALGMDTYGEPGQGTPPEMASLVTKLGYVFKYLVNRKTGDGTTEKLYNYGDTVIDQKALTSEAGGVVTKSRIVSGP